MKFLNINCSSLKNGGWETTFLFGKSYFQDFREGNSSAPNRKHSNIVWMSRVPGGYFFGGEYSLKKIESSLKFPSLPMILIPHSPLSLNSIQTINKQTNNTKKHLETPLETLKISRKRTPTNICPLGCHNFICWDPDSVATT